MTVRTKCQKRRAPFLHRNWIKGVQALQDSAAMGNIVSSPVRKGSHQHHQADDDAPPLKRRRISSPEALEVDHLVASPKASDSRSALRIEVLKAFHKDSKKVRSYQNGSLPRDVVNTKASCRITVSERSRGHPRVLHCQSQVCDLTTFKNPVGPHRIARIRLPRPFFIPEESLLINRPDDGKFDLSDSYEVVVELEAAHDGHWPPLDAGDFGMPPGDPLYGRNRVLSSRFDRIFGRLKSPLSVSSGYPPSEFARETDYVMEVDLRWSSGFRALRRLEKGSMPCINAIDPYADLFTDAIFVPSLDDVLKDNDTKPPVEGNLDHEEEPEGAQTPSRSLRARETKVYNLKVLSDQAQGIERKQRARGAHASTGEGRVNYLLPSDQPVCLDYFRCVTCGVFHQSMAQLQVHLQTLHPGYEYALETTSQGPQFRVTSRCEASSSPSKEYELRQAVKPFDLQSFITGDHSWISSRLGLDSADDVFSRPPGKALLERPPPPARPPMPKSAQPRPPPRCKRPRVLVPDIPQPLFDPISRARLVPGQEVPRRMPDTTWLIQKHRESIADFSDVTPAEKEYIWEWDGHILKEGLTSAAYLPRAWLDFVRQKADWLVAADQRMLEFGKHASVLIARDLIDDETLQEAFGCIDEARSKRLKTETDGAGVRDVGTRQSPRAAQICKNANGCAVCQLPVLGPRMLVCANKKCSRRLYHSDCVEDGAITPVSRREWLCNACSTLERSV